MIKTINIKGKIRQKHVPIRTKITQYPFKEFENIAFMINAILK